MSDSKDKLTARFNKVVELVYESDAVSDENNKFVTKEDVQKAINQKVYRNNN